MEFTATTEKTGLLVLRGFLAHRERLVRLVRRVLLGLRELTGQTEKTDSLVQGGLLVLRGQTDLESFLA